MKKLFELEIEENLPIGDNPEEDLFLFLSTVKSKIAESKYNENLLNKAFWFCVDKHRNVTRKSGKPYYTHPVKVAILLVNVFPFADVNSICAALLHDTIEDVEDVTFELVAEEFNEEIAVLVDGVTKINFKGDSKTINKAYTYKKIFTALLKDIRIILIKLADRLHNIRTLHYLNEAKQKDIALETLNFYTPIAHKLGLEQIKAELENLSFFFLDNDTYKAIRKALDKKKFEFIHYINLFTDLIQNALNEQNINHTFIVVHKHEYEIYRMLQDGKALSDIDNFYSIVIILDSNDSTICYTAHGVLANTFTSINLMDFISNPKIDWNRSLSSELYGPDGKKVEIIIRTKKMEKISEEGFLSVYNLNDLNDNTFKGFNLDEEEFILWEEWVQDIIETRGEDAIQLIWNSVKVNLFDKALKIFDKDGTNYVLPQGASVLDYAFNKSKELGIITIAAKINGVVQDIGYKLQDGDQIQLITSEVSSPKPDWTRFVITNKAILSIYKLFKNNKRELITDELKKEFTLNIIGEDKEKMLQRITQAIGENNMVSIQLDTTGNLFTGVIKLKMKDRKTLNYLYHDLFKISGIKSIEFIS